MTSRAVSRPALAVFLEELVRLRAMAGLSVPALADRLGVEEVEIRSAEEGRRRVDVVELQLWAFACGSTLTEFMTRLDDRTRRPVTTLH